MKRMVILVPLACVILCSGCRTRQKPREFVKPVKIETAVLYTENQATSYPGKIRAASEVNVAFRVSGQILQINVEPGTYVKEGDVIAVMDPRDYQTQFNATEAEYNSVKGEAERIMALYEKTSVSANDYEKALYGLQQISSKYEAHKNALEDTKLRAPFSGVVQKKMFFGGESVSAGMPVISIVSSGLPEIEINLPASEYVNRDNFDKFHCTVDIFPDMEYELVPVGISPKANLNQLYTMRLRFRSKETPMPSPGMSAMVSISYKDNDATSVKIPFPAVFPHEGGSFVWLFNPENNTVHYREISLREISTDGTVVVSSGLQPGDIVVSAGVHSLTDGERVKPLMPASETNVGGLL